MIEKLRDINEKLISLNKNNEKELKKQILIKKILKENDCFLKMSIENAYSILRDLKISEENLKKVYMELV
jgi:predicted HTH domain antitoxin